MLDKKTECILELLAEKADNGYCVLEKRALLKALPPKMKIDEQTMQSAITFLKEKEYVDVKYQDKEEICLCTTPKAQSYLEGERHMQQRTKIANSQLLLVGAVAFVAAFLGALAAVLVGRLF